MRFHSNRTKHLVVLTFVAVLLAPSPADVLAAGQERASSQNSVFDGWHFAPYCGLYCVYLTVKMAGMRIHFAELVKPEYLSSNKGSRLQDLLAALEDNGLHARICRRLTVNDLRRSPYPIILHVKPNLESKEYNHYELFLSREGNKARIVNPPEAVRLVPFSEIVPRWRGDGLVLSTKPVDLSVFGNPRRRWLIVWVAIGAAIVLCVRYSCRWFKRSTPMPPVRFIGLSIGQTAGLALLASLCSLGYHFRNEAGFFVFPKAVEALQRVYAATFVPKISIRTTRKLLGNGAIFIDARMPSDYRKDHLKGAVNVPVYSTDEECQATTADIAKDACIVLYCQSAACKFAEQVALKLIDDGFSNISIFKGGWEEWVAQNGSGVEPSG